jgi:hypothetical protein
MEKGRPNAPEDHAESQEYEPPRVEDRPTEGDPAVTVPGAVIVKPRDEDDGASGPEWRR